MVQHQMFDPGVADLLDTDILTSPSKRKRKLKIDDISTSDRSELEDYIVLENVYRMFGITFFPLVDPIDLKIKDASGEIFVDREMLGIRLEVFSERTSQFEKPHYVLLKRGSNRIVGSCSSIQSRVSLMSKVYLMTPMGD